MKEKFIKGKNKMKSRYEMECNKIGNLANTALNCIKNANKPRFESLDIMTIFGLLDEEIEELKDELSYYPEYTFLYPREAKDIAFVDFSKVENELSDVLACCTGLLAKINTLKQIQQDDEA